MDLLIIHARPESLEFAFTSYKKTILVDVIGLLGQDSSLRPSPPRWIKVVIEAAARFHCVWYEGETLSRILNPFMDFLMSA